METVRFEIVCWDKTLLTNPIKLGRKTMRVTPMKYAKTFLDLYPIARYTRYIAKAWDKASGTLICEFQATNEEIDRFYNEHEDKFPALPICKDVEAVRWVFPNKSN